MKIPMVIRTCRCEPQELQELLQPHEVLQPQSVWQSHELQVLQELHGLQQPQLLPQPVLQSTIRQPRATGALTCRQT